MLRATTRPGPADLPRTLDLDDPAATRSWLGRVWQHEDTRDAVRTASPVLYRAAGDVVRGVRTQPQQIRRAALSVASYLLRWQHRPTPFGRFAGTAPVSVGATVRVRWDDTHREVVRADADWIADIVQRLQDSPDLLERLPVVANNTAQVRGDRLVAPGAPADGRDRLMAPVEVSVPYRRTVQAAMRAARIPTPYGELRAELTAMFPAGAGGRIDALLADLLAQDLLITSLRAPSTTLDALGHVCGELEKADAHTLPDVADLVRVLYAIRDDLNGRAPALPTGTLSAVIDRMTKESSAAPVPLLIDTALDCDVQIPAHVVAEAEAAVSALYRLSPQPYGYQQWRDYHRRFRARYGVGSAVPVLELVADSGLGWPAEYVGSERGRAAKQVTDRDDAVLALVQQALMENRGELVLTDAVVAGLADAAGSERPTLVPRAEVAFEIRASSSADLARGAFQLMLTGVPRPGSSMLGRFAHLLPPAHQDVLAGTYLSSRPDAVTAQLSFGPRRRRNENVTRTARLLPDVIALGEHRAADEHVIGPADIAVTADARRFHLVQLSTGRPIDVRVLHALEAGIQTPPLARLLTELGNARCAIYKPFDFGTARRLPYLPRVRYRRTILTPARWLLRAEDLPGRVASVVAWDEALTAWRTRLRVPDRIALVEFDQRLALDLTHPVHRRLLRSRLNDVRRLELREVADPDLYGWIGRAHEILLPLTHTQPDAVTLPTPRRAIATAEEDIQLPGAGTVLRAHLHAHPDRYSEILDRHLPTFLGALGDAPLWWFVRHREMARPEAGQHLALFLRIDSGTYGTVAEQVNAWAAGLRRSRLVSRLTLETYVPQTGRYGRAAALEAAHRVFAADSAAALAQIRLVETGAVAPQALAAASVVGLTAALAGSADQGGKWLIENVPRGGGHLDRELCDQARGLAAPGGWSLLASLPAGGTVSQAWQARDVAVRSYREALAGQQGEPLTVVRSLLHQHHVRALGVGPRAEAVTLRLARAAALCRFPAKKEVRT
ncbi:lantibiotic dehydratase [Streptomyces paludis]|uniref:Lantibiotic dehydratase n=2 Tax=Streptomyces paludis TaxID=2282738 RepID=A0A345I1H8_9ACTN|nr:lantibiotic dehydratase [Streptomyces paludis]